jgi:hypothetical protein
MPSHTNQDDNAEQKDNAPPSWSLGPYHFSTPPLSFQPTRKGDMAHHMSYRDDENMHTVWKDRDLVDLPPSSSHADKMGTLRQMPRCRACGRFLGSGRFLNIHNNKCDETDQNVREGR